MPHRPDSLSIATASPSRPASTPIAAAGRDLSARIGAPGTWRWGGADGHPWFVDRARGLSVVALTSTLYEGRSGRFVTDLRDAVDAAAEVRA